MTYSLLTGKTESPVYPPRNPTPDIDRTWTVADYHRQARQLIHDASTNHHSDRQPERLLAAAAVLAELAKTASGRTRLPAKLGQGQLGSTRRPAPDGNVI